MAKVRDLLNVALGWLSASGAAADGPARLELLEYVEEDIETYEVLVGMAELLEGALDLLAMHEQDIDNVTMLEKAIDEVTMVEVLR